MRRKLLSIMLALTVALSFAAIPTSASAVTTITDAADLYAFAEAVNGGVTYEGQEIQLMADIVINTGVVDFNGVLRGTDFTEWTPIGTTEAPFKGTFNGNGHTITGLYINDSETDVCGLFGYIYSAEILNVTVKDSYISAGDHAGAIAGYAVENSAISSCHNDNTSIYTANRAGGIVGWTDKSDVFNCSSNGYCYSDRCSGGVVGDVYSNGKIYNCYNGGYVVGKLLVGGISGGTTRADIQNCINVGEVSGSDCYLIAGGGGSRTITNCFALKNDTVNTDLTIGTSSATAKTFETTAAILTEPVKFNDVQYTTALDALNAWVSEDTTDIIYSPWVQTSMYPYLRDGVVSSIRTSYGSEVSEWSSKEMEEAYEANLIPENLVGEDLQTKVTRSEFASIALKLYEALSGEEVAAVATPFADISGDKNETEIAKAYGLNIAVGISDTQFQPNTKINREQLATMLCRTIKKYKFDDWTYATDSKYYLDSEGTLKFEDDDEISDYAKQSVYYMVKMGIINGVDSTHFAPKNTTDQEEAMGYATATREQAIALSLRIYNLSELWA